MKFLFALMVVLTLVFFAPPVLKKFNSQEIHGSTDKRVLESVKDVRRNLQTQQRHVFDVAFGLLKEFKSGEGENAFAKTVGGKSTDEIIEMARQEVAARIAAGDPKFKQFSSWDDMLSKEEAEDAPKKPGPQQPPVPLRNSERTGRGN